MSKTSTLSEPSSVVKKPLNLNNGRSAWSVQDSRQMHMVREALPLKLMMPWSRIGTPSPVQGRS